MAHHIRILQISALLFLTQGCNCFLLRSMKPKERIIIHLEENEHLLLPKYSRHTVVKILRPLPINDDKFYFEPSKINKKPTVHVKHTHVGKLKSSLETNDQKNCCGKDWTASKEVGLEELFRPVSLAAAENHGITKFEDIKPVTEVIEDDLKYDFRTKTHSY